MDSEQINDWLNRSALYIALVVAWVATLGSLYFSEVLGYVPCQLCWYQRVFMYPMAGLIALGLLRLETHLPHLVIPFTVVGGAISAYHYLLQKTDIFDAASACEVGVPCTTIWINWFGFVTIPFLALLAFFLITVFSLVALFAGEPVEREGQTRDWLPVAGAVAVVVAVFGVMAIMHDEPQPTPARAEVIHTETAAAGAELYLHACAACHGPDAAGIEHLGNSLVESDVLAMTDEDALAFLREGVDLDNPRNTTGLMMPASGGRPDLSDEELLSILEYVRALAPEASSSP